MGHRIAILICLFAGGCSKEPSDFSVEIRCAEQNYRMATTAVGEVGRTSAAAHAVMWLKRAEGIAPDAPSSLAISKAEMKELYFITRPPEPPMPCDLSNRERSVALDMSVYHSEAIRRTDTNPDADTIIDEMARH